MRCGDVLQWYHGAYHYESMLVSARSVLTLKEEILKADWKGFGHETTKDFLALCDFLARRLNIDT